MSCSRVSTGDSFIPSSCEMKYDPAFKPLQGNPAFFWVRASRGPFHLRQKTQSASHIPISEGRLLLRCLWKDGLPLHSKTGNHSNPEMIWGARDIRQAALLKLMILYTWDCCLRESLEVPKWVKPLVLYDVDRGVVMEPMQGKLASSQFDFGYSEQFCQYLSRFCLIILGFRTLYPKSNWDEANFPCIGSITTPRSTSYRTSGLTPFRNL